MTNQEEKKTISPLPYEKMMETISKLQGNRAAIVLLENPDGTTTSFRYKIDEKSAADIIKSAYNLG